MDQFILLETLRVIWMGKPINGTNHMDDAFISKYNPDVTKVWKRLLGTSQNDCGFALKLVVIDRFISLDLFCGSQISKSIQLLKIILIRFQNLFYYLEILGIDTSNS